MGANKSLSLLLKKAQEIDWSDLSQLRQVLLDIASHPEATEYQFQDAVNIALDFDSPQIALEIHDVYEKRFGQTLSGDTDRRAIEASQTPKGGKEIAEKSFKRQTFLQRSHFSNHFTFYPVKEIVITASSITFIVSHFFCSTRRYQYGHADVLEIYLRERKSWKSMGNTAVSFHERTCRVITKDHSFVFDVSGSYGDFRNPRALVDELTKIRAIEKVGRKWRVPSNRPTTNFTSP